MSGHVRSNAIKQEKTKQNKTKILTFLQRVTQLCSSFFITLKLEATVVMVTTSLNINAFHQVALASELSPSLPPSLSQSPHSFSLSLTQTHKTRTQNLITTFFTNPSSHCSLGTLHSVLINVIEIVDYITSRLILV